MAGLDRARLDFAVTGVNETQLKNWFRNAFWAWFDANKHEEVFTVKIWIFRRTITVEDCKPVFERFFGQAPMLPQGVV